MPLYEYECDACGERFEVIQKSFSSPAPEICEKCGKGPVHRLQSSPAIQFKGSGFYITDYAKKEKSEGSGLKGKSDGSKSDGSKSESTSDSKTTDAKTDSATSKDSSAKSDAPAASTSSESTSTSTKKD
jgi:putative FmdB family regulatory protein